MRHVCLVVVLFWFVAWVLAAGERQTWQLGSSPALTSCCPLLPATASCWDKTSSLLPSLLFSLLSPTSFCMGLCRRGRADFLLCPSPLQAYLGSPPTYLYPTQTWGLHCLSQEEKEGSFQNRGRDWLPLHRKEDEQDRIGTFLLYVLVVGRDMTAWCGGQTIPTGHACSAHPLQPL